MTTSALLLNIYNDLDEQVEELDQKIQGLINLREEVIARRGALKLTIEYVQQSLQNEGQTDG